MREDLYTLPCGHKIKVVSWFNGTHACHQVHVVVRPPEYTRITPEHPMDPKSGDRDV